jgi:F0F1-type ATP synthase membrane subunit b/b'
MVAYDSRTEEERMAAENAQLNVARKPSAPVMSPADAAAQARLNNQKAVQQPDGSFVFVPLTGAELDANRSSLAGLDQPATAPPPLPGLPTTPAAPLTPQQALARYGASVPAFEGAITGSMARGRPVAAVAQNVDPRFGRIDMGGVAPGVAPAAEQGPAEVDRARIDALLGNVSKVTSGIMGIGQRDLEFSAAQAQLRQGLDQGQRQALSLARSGNRRDRAGNEARAVQASTELAAQTGQAAAGLRANEEAAQQQIRLDAYKAAGELGLNAGALDLNAQSLDMNAATNFLNQLFGRENLQLQIDQQEAERVTNFVRDMALLSRDYYSLGMQERQAVRDDLTRRYGINEQTRLALEQIEAQGKVNWEQVGANMLAGAVVGAAQVGAKAAIGG